ncbi:MULTISPECIES: hypothetical protein [unclassified Vibrio]|uniref:hypothetical protein n=1 Tax=unclassified Vibrio TaxID=2614977 RepID=UPI0010A672A9|nr:MULTISPECIES: hypothetical protein [unclassified Vibrio]WGY45704.1 hypothetical protein J0X00_02320 [Vibrio sp. ABG19]
MELRNKAGQVTHLADNLTLKEVRDMGFTIDLCDETYDREEHWRTQSTPQGRQRDYPDQS